MEAQIQILLAIVMGIVVAGITSYFNAKFQQKAIAEEIGKITHEVESVKKVFQDGTEKLKQELAVLTNKHNVLFAEEKEALNIYLSAWNIWINIIESMVIDYNSKKYKEVEDIEKYQYDITKKRSSDYEKVLISMSKLELFLNDTDIIQSVYELNLKTHEHQKIHEDYIDDYVIFSFNIHSLEKDLEKAKAESNKFDEKAIYDVIMDKRKKLTERSIVFNEMKQAKFSEVDIAKKKFISLSRAYIRKDFQK